MSCEMESASLARLADLIEREVNPANGLPAVFHGEAVGSGIVVPHTTRRGRASARLSPRSGEDRCVALRLVTGDQVHVFALTRASAARLAEQLRNVLPSSML
jgi:hypothetical protein